MVNNRLNKVPIRHRKFVEANLMRLSKIIQKRREERKITQEDLAERLGLSLMTIQFN